MIELVCLCGETSAIEESGANAPVQCGKCGRTILPLTAEDLPPDAGVGDFDAILLVLKGPSRQDEMIFLGGVKELEIGKLTERHLTLSGSMVSRLHARLQRIDFGPSRWRIEDNRSTNGLFVNGRRVQEHELQNGDVIRIGDYELQYRFLTAPRPVAASPQKAKRAAASRSLAAEPTPVAQALKDSIPCPSCEQVLPCNARICIDCGIDIRTGRPILTAKGIDENELYIKAENTLRVLSWPVPTGFYPIASEAYGTIKPIATWVICGITVFCSLIFLGAGCSTEFFELPPGAHYMLWPTQQGPVELSRIGAMPGRQSLDFAWYQLFTHALLHADIFHLAGNMLFLLVFGTRVNALIGNVATAVLYPLLAAAAAFAELSLGTKTAWPVPMLGASGAVMGMAGLYFVLFPLYRVFMAIWARWFLLFPLLIFRIGVHLSWSVFAVRGFWVILFYISFDVLYTTLRLPTGVAHWAHLGGFGAGAAIAIGMLLSRTVNSRGGDIFSVTLGKHAWALVGKPSQRRQDVPASVLAEKAISMNYRP
jgi:membrane associated rhomboid family serine protease